VRWRRLGWTLAGLIALALLAVFGLAANHSSANGRPAPPLPRERLAGAPTTLSSLLAASHGHPAAVVFWASWCTPCTEEAPALERFARSPAGAGRIVGVDWSDARAGAQSFIRRYAWSFPNVRDAEGTVGNAYRMTGLPTTFIIDAHGRIERALRGPQNERSLAAAMHSVERS
jgi:cytochrome c biogenesis protein CcmG/thiol:disulfide interchange protein DsbE